MSDDAPAHTPGDPWYEAKFLVCVDRRPHSRVAARYAAMRAHNTGGRVALLHVMEPAGFQHWVAVGDVMEEERRVEAEVLVESTATEVRELVVSVAEMMLREGDIGEEILAQVEAGSSIDLLVAGAAAPEKKCFSLITFLAGKLVGRLSIPLVVVPGNPTDAQIENMT